MPLDLGKTMLQLDRVSRGLVADSGHKETRLTAFIEAVSKVDAATAIAKTRYDPDRPFLAAQVLDSLLGSYAPVEPPMDWCIVAVDGSHIDVDRHLPVGCYLINMGGCSLTYGSQPDAVLTSEPHLYAHEDELVIQDQNAKHRQQYIQGGVLGAKRAVEEIRGLGDAVRKLPPNMPTLALMDGALVMFIDRGYQDFVIEELMEEGFVAALDDLRSLAEKRPLAVAAYVSLPGYAEFMGAVDTVEQDKGKVRGLVSFFGRETPVELDFLQVEKA